jgi:hypothetical protein
MLAEEVIYLSSLESTLNAGPHSVLIKLAVTCLLAKIRHLFIDCVRGDLNPFESGNLIRCHGNLEITNNIRLFNVLVLQEVLGRDHLLNLLIGHSIVTEIGHHFRILLTGLIGYNSIRDLAIKTLGERLGKCLVPLINKFFHILLINGFAKLRNESLASKALADGGSEFIGHLGDSANRSTYNLNVEDSFLTGKGLVAKFLCRRQ